ncbi:hypothetical protein BPMI_01952c [Candidatus Burkholderia pumila]|uniref:Uncharacterized protein n=1 Tax=Candidatus Burkholderia pumila TaxID=1090375 RepID=A0ABR5HPQ4_9BURK|nr:hypothetical protein BPMI_01952c [Candidatus Burkholderia pumila]
MTGSVTSIAIRLVAARFIAAIVVSAVTLSCAAQTLAAPRPIGRLSDVTQFGMRPDGQFVLCDGDECPPRTQKHLTQPPAERVASPGRIISEPAIRSTHPRKEPSGINDTSRTSHTCRSANKVFIRPH